MSISNKAMTLAEVLITLGIIGVVASITISTLIGNGQKAEYLSKIKKTYTTIEQAIKTSEANYGPYQTWDYGTTINDGNEALAFANTYLVPYMNVSKNCGTAKGCWVTTIKKFAGSNFTRYGDTTNYAKFILMDGTAMHVSIPAAGRAFLHFDINGTKSPNIYGKDIFSYTLAPNKKLGLGVYVDWSRNDIISDTANGCNKSAEQPDSCLILIIRDGWQIKDDYPW